MPTATSEVETTPKPLAPSGARQRLQEVAGAMDEFFQSDDWKTADSTARQQHLDRITGVFDEEYSRAAPDLNPDEADQLFNSGVSFLKGRLAESGDAPPLDAFPSEGAMKAADALRQTRNDANAPEPNAEDYGKYGLEAIQLKRSSAQERYPKELLDFIKKTGMRPEHVYRLMDDREALERLNDKAVVMKTTGDVAVPPQKAMDEAEWNSAVDATNATPEKKAKAKAHRLKVRDQLAGKIEFSLAAVDPEWEKWSAGMAGEMKDASVGEKVERFIKWRKASGAKMSAIDRAVDQNAASFVKQFFGLIGGITNIGMMKEAAATAGEIEQANRTIRSAIGGAGATGFAVDLFGGLAPTIAFSPLARLATTNLGAMRLMAGIGAAQGYGGKYADASAAYSEQGLSDQEAHMKAQLPALVSALTTYALARMMPGGVESIGQINSAKAAAKTAYRKWAGELLADVKDEALEEAFQALSDEITAKFTYDPKKDMRTALENIFMSGLMGGIGGGVVGAVSRYANKVKPILETAEQMRKAGYPLAAAETEKTAEIEATKQYWADVAKAKARKKISREKLMQGAKARIHRLTEEIAAESSRKYKFLDDNIPNPAYGFVDEHLIARLRHERSLLQKLLNADDAGGIAEMYDFEIYQNKAVEHTQANEGPQTERAAYGRTGDVYDAFGNVQRKAGGFLGLPDAGNPEGTPKAAVDANYKPEPAKESEPKNEKAQSVPSVQKADESVRLPQAEVAPTAPPPEPVTPAAAKPVEPIPASQSPRTTPKPKSASPQTAGKVEAPSSQNPFSASIAKTAIRKDGGSWVVKDFDGLPDFVDAPKDVPLIPDGDLPQGTEYVIVDKRFNGNPRPSYAFTPGGLVYSYESGFSGISPWRLAGAIEGESSAPTVAKDAAVAPAPPQPAAAPAAEQPTPAPIEQVIADANWRGTVREVPAPRSMGGEGVKLYIPVDASGKDVSVGGQTILGKTPAEAIELAQKNAKPAPAPIAEPTKGRAETDSAWLEALMGSGSEAVATPQAVQSFKPLKPIIDTLRSDLEKQTEDWDSRKYKPNKTQVELRGDGPGKRDSISIGSINEGRRQKALDAIGGQIRAIDKLSDAISTPEGEAALDSAIKRTWDEAGKTFQNSRFKNQGDLFESLLIEDVLKLKPARGAYDSLPLSKAIRARMEAESTPSSPAPVAAPTKGGMTQPEMDEAIAVLLKAPVKAGGKPRVSLKTQAEEAWFRRGFEAANGKPGQPPPEQPSGVPAKDQKLHDAFASGWSHAQIKLREKPTPSSPAPAAAPAPAEPQAKEPQAKEPWRMTKAQWETRDKSIWGDLSAEGTGLNAARTYHRLMVRDALREGKPVPAEVLADYPDLAKQQPSPAIPQSEGGIFGYAWADIRSKQQGGKLAALIRGNAPKATESDFAVLEKHGMDWLYDNEKGSIIDRLGLPVDKPSKKAEAEPEKIITWDQRKERLQELQKWKPRKPLASVEIKYETYEFTTKDGSHIIGRHGNEAVYVRDKLDPTAGEVFSVNAKKTGEGLELAIAAIDFLKQAGKKKIVFTAIGTPEGRGLVEGLQKLGLIGEQIDKFDSDTRVFSLDKPAKQPPAPVSEAAKLRAKIVKGATVEVALVRGSKLTHRAKVQDVDTQNGVVTVTFKKGKKFNGGETQTVRLDQVAPLKSVRTRMLNEAQFEGMTEDQKRQTKADAKEFDNLVAAHPEMNWYNWRVNDLAGTKSGDMDIAAERKRASEEAMKEIGGDRPGLNPDNSIMKAELLPKLKAMIEEKAHELAREIPEDSLPDDTDFLPPGETPEPVAPKLRPSDGKGTGELLQGDAAPFNLVAETAADIAKREAREAAEQIAKDAKDAAEAKAKQDKEQGNLFDDDPFTIADTAPATSLPVESVQRAVRVVAGRLAGAMPHEVIADGSQYPQRVKDAFRKKYGASGDLNRIRGVVVGGRIYINAAAIENAREAIETFMHEAAGHGGVDALLKAFGEKATTQLDAMLKRLFPDDYAAVQRSYEPREQVSETLARIMQRVGPEMSAQTRTRWQRVMDWLRNALNNLGVKRWSTNDVMALLRRGVDAVRKSSAATPDAGAVRMSYAGEKAQVPQFMRDSLDTAKAMAAAGKTSEEIRAVTGWFPGKYDGKMRWEVPDEAVALNEKPELANLRKEVAEATSRFEEVKAKRQGFSPAFNEAQVRMTNAQDKLRRAAGSGDMATLGERLVHPELFALYPAAKNIRLVVEPMQPNYGGYFDPISNKIAINSVHSKEAQLSSLLHEIQHWTQKQENFAEGGDLSQFLYSDDFKLSSEDQNTVDNIDAQIADLRKEERELGEFFRNLPDSMKGVGKAEKESRRLNAISYEVRALNDRRYAITKPARDKMAMDKYRRTAGEIESRDVQARQNFTPEQRKAVAPYSGENIAKEDAIVMSGGGPVQMSTAPARITPEQDREYLAAVKRGDMETAQRMGDKAAIAAGAHTNADGSVQHFIRGGNERGKTVFPGASFWTLDTEAGRKVAEGYRDSAGDFLGRKIPDAERKAKNADIFRMYRELPESLKKGHALAAAMHAHGRSSDVSRYYNESAEQTFERVRQLVIKMAKEERWPHPEITQALTDKDWDKVLRLSEPHVYLAFEANPIGMTNGEVRDQLTSREQKHRYDALTSRANYFAPFKSITRAYLMFKNPLRLNGTGAITPQSVEQARKDGYDAIWSEGAVGGDTLGRDNRIPEVVVLSSEQVKSADPSTIPLSERFNPESSDIRFSLKDENPEATSTARDSTNAARVARGEEPLEVITKPAIDALKEGALAELARNPDAGRELVREIIGATGQPDITPEKEALLAMHRRTLQNEIEMQSDRAMDESLTPEQREIANERWDDLEQEITELEDATNRTGSAWSNWGRIRMQETLRDFSFAMLTKRARKAKGGEQLTRDERAELKAQADKIAALHELELARRTELANIEREEAAAAAFQQGKAEAEREAEENQPDPLIMEHSRQFVAKLRAKYSPAVRSVMGLFDKGIGSKAAGESDVKMSLAPDPEKPEWFTKVVQAGVIQMADKKLSKEKWLASLKVLTRDTEGNLDPYADELWAASRAIIEADIAADTEESKRVKATKMKRNASKEQLIEGMAERVAEDGDTSNLGRYLKKLAVKLIESGVDTREALVDAMHDSVKDIDPSLTREAVMDLWSDYGKFRPATTDEVKVKAAQLRGEVQQVRKLMDMEKGLAAKLTGIGRVEPSAEHRKLTKQVEDAKRRGGFTVTDPARQLKTALDAIQTRLKNEIADMDYAIATRKPLAEHKNAITYDAQTKALKAQRDAKKAEYEKLFPKDTAAADLAAISRALDRSIAELSEQIKSGDLYPGKQGRRLTSPEIEAKRARIEALRDERTVLRGLDTARVEAAKMAATQARVDELNRQRAAGWPDSPTGTPTVDTPELAALKAQRDELLKERQASQRPPTDPEMRKIEALDKLIAEKQAKIAAGDTSSKPKSQNVKTAQVTAREAELRRLTVELAKLRNSDIARQLEQLKSRKSRQLADLLEKIAKKDFEPKAKPPEKPTDPELQSIEFQVSQAKGAVMEGMADLARSRRTRFQKAKDTVADVFHTLRAIFTGGEFSGVFRQGKLAALSHPVVTFGQSVPAMFRAFGLGGGALTATAKAAGELVQGNVSAALKTLKEHGESKEHAEMNKIWARPNAAAYKRSGLALHNPWDFTAAQLEGNYRSRWANKIPFIAGSGRAYTLFLNNLRAGLFDVIYNSRVSSEGSLSIEQEKGISILINEMTGSGNLGVRGQKASEYLNIFFFAPKFVVSRFQMVTGHSAWKADAAGRKMVAKEYGKILTGIAVMYALYAAFKDKEEPIETDPRSSKFGKIPMGNGTYVDPLAGLSQATVFLSRMLSGEVKDYEGKIHNIRLSEGKKINFADKTAFDVMTKFVRSKLSPIAGATVNWLDGADIMGKPITVKGQLLNFATPMTYGDIYDAMRAQGVPKGTALSILAMFGEGVNTYENDSKPTHVRSHRR